MSSSLMRAAVPDEPDRLLRNLSQWQHVGPHQSVGAILQRAVRELGVCPQAAARAAEALQIDTARPIGRLRRTELTQLAHTLHRHWRASQPRQPAASST
jgi:hypothetical protein